MSCKVGNQTNSQDPQAVNSRVFVGNLNTFQCSKTDVERRFQRYGRIAGISMHKGYAFIQFTNPFDARSACLGENGRLLWGQTLDVNMVAEPKAHQTGRKRQNIAKTGNDWDYYYDSYYAQMGLQTPRLMPPMKRPRIHVPPNPYVPVVAPTPNGMVNSSIFHNTNAAAAAAIVQHQQQQQQQFQQSHQQLQQQQQQQQQRRNHNNNKGNSSSCNNNNNNHNHNSNKSVSSPINNVSISELKTYSTPDILICGNCRELFSEIEQLMQHKQNYCKLRFTCKCHMLNGCTPKAPGEEPASLLCSQCKDSFQSAWDLMVHVQTAHLINIYQLGGETNGGGSDQEHDQQDGDHSSSIPSPNNLLAILGNGNINIGANNGDIEGLTHELDEDNHKCDTSCQTNSSFLVESNNNSRIGSASVVGSSGSVGGEDLLNNGIVIIQPMSSGSSSSCSSSSISTCTYTDGLILDPVVANSGGNDSGGVGNNGIRIDGMEEEEETMNKYQATVPQPQQQGQSTRINGLLKTSSSSSTPSNFLKATSSTQTLGCQTDQQMMMMMTTTTAAATTTTNNLNNNNNNNMTTTSNFDDSQDSCSTSSQMLTSIKVEDGPHVVKYVTGTV